MSAFRTSFVSEEDNCLHRQVGRFWKMESAGSLLETDVGESTYDKKVKVTPQDCDALGFLWWPNGDLQRDPKEYQMLVHLSGVTSSPNCAGNALHKTAQESQLNKDEAFKTVTENFYIDDCLKAVEAQEEAVTLAHKLRCLLQSGGFRLMKWISNDPGVLKTIPESERARPWAR
nr:uncharacterized protein LOC129278948 [Lytechinus pictus]